MICKVCGKKAESDFCFLHKGRKTFPKYRKKDIMTDSAVPNGQGVRNNLLMREFFLTIWKERPHKSEISGASLGQEVLSIFFHHILPKKKYDVAKFDKENIILLSLQEHESVELNMYKYEKINYLREKLLLKYDI